MRRALLLVFTMFVVACSHRAGCDPVDLDLDLNGGKDDCTAAGGTCTGLGFCPAYSSPSSLHCGFLSGCCMPGGNSSGSSGYPNGGGGTSGSPPRPSEEGTCNGTACAPGCQCLPSVNTWGACTSTCDCSPDAGFDAGAADAADAADAGDADADASDDAGDPDAGELDAGDPDAGDAATMTVEGPPAPCGFITCSARCSCLSRSLSVCECRSGACNP